MDTPDCITSSKLALKEHQLKIVNSILQNTKRAIGVIHTTGSGKTLSAVVSAKCFLDSQEDGFVFVVTPASLRDNYIKEFVRAYGEFDSRIQLFTPESFAKSPQNLTGSMLIVDEAHYFRTKIVLSSGALEEAKKGKKASALINKAVSAKKVILLTATPVVNTEYDLENLLALIDGRQPVNERIFMRSLTIPEEKRKMLEGRFDFYSPSQEELERYPKLEVEPIFFEMPEGIYQEYRRQEDFLKSSGPKLDNFIVDSELEGDLTKFYTGLRFAANLKENESETDFEQDKASWIASQMKKTTGEKWLIYSEYVGYGIDIVASTLAAKKIRFDKITGKIPPDARQEIVNNANRPLQPDEPSYAFLVTRAGGTGLDLKGFSRAVIFESAWNFATIDQVFGRTVRYNSLEGTPFDTVKGYLMMMVKPKEFAAGVQRVLGTYGNLFDNELKSIDLLLYSRAQAKKKRVDNLIKDMKVYNTDFEKVSVELEKGANRILSDLKDFRMTLTCNPLMFEIESNVADIDSHTVLFIPNETFNIKFYIEIFEFPCLSVSALSRAFAVSKDSNIQLVSEENSVKVFAAIETRQTSELTFDVLIDDIEKTFTEKFKTDDLLKIVSGISAWINITDSKWNHGKFIFANIWLRSASTTLGGIVSKYSGEKTFKANRFNISGRTIEVFLEF